MFKKFMRPVSCLLIGTFLLLDLSVPMAQAQMIGTESVIAAQRGEMQRAQVAAFLAREDVRQVMEQHGIDALEAQKRVASLSDEEVAQLAASIDRMPAGGDGLGTVVGAAVLIFVILLVTDILGYTHVFPFVSSARR